MNVLEKQSQRWLKKKAWEVFSRYIRKKDKVCYTCEKGRADNAGHWRHGSTKIGYFDERNVHGQCVYCNLRLHGNGNEYSLRQGEKYGIKKAKEMWKEFNQTHNWTRKELIEIIKEYS